MNKEFPKATVAFGEVIKTNPQDETAKLFLTLTGSHIAEGVSEDWTGVQEISG